jgi:hypothetical protein
MKRAQEEYREADNFSNNQDGRAGTPEEDQEADMKN